LETVLQELRVRGVDTRRVGNARQVELEGTTPGRRPDAVEHQPSGRHIAALRLSARIVGLFGAPEGGALGAHSRMILQVAQATREPTRLGLTLSRQPWVAPKSAVDDDAIIGRRQFR
jgi:hypothetical protein